MPNMINSVRERYKRRLAYYRTVSELSALPLTSQRDLGIAAGDVHKIAHRAVYSN